MHRQVILVPLRQRSRSVTNPLGILRECIFKRRTPYTTEVVVIGEANDLDSIPVVSSE